MVRSRFAYDVAALRCVLAVLVPAQGGPTGQVVAEAPGGDEVTPESTPQGLDVEDEDQIDVILKR